MRLVLTILRYVLYIPLSKYIQIEIPLSATVLNLKSDLGAISKFQVHCIISIISIKLV